MPRLKLRQIAEAQGLNISQLQRRSGLDMGMVRRYWYNEGRKGQLTEVSLPALYKLAQVLGVEPGDLITSGDEEQRPSRLSPALAVA